MHLDTPTVQHRTLSATSVVTLDTGSQSVEQVPSPQTEWENTTPQERQKAPWEEGAY